MKEVVGFWEGGLGLGGVIWGMDLWLLGVGGIFFLVVEFVGEVFGRGSFG